VKFLYERLSTPQITGVLDPFSGAGTTVLESKMLGHNSWGIELNPFLAKFTNLALDWSSTLKELQKTEPQILEKISSTLAKIKKLNLDEAILKLRVPVPPIHNPMRWLKLPPFFGQVVTPRLW
jgi:adenine-specific DNA methylase